MMMQLMVDLPEALGRRAKLGGLLNQEALIGMIEDALRRKAAGKFLALAPLNAPDLTPDLSDDVIVAEVKLVRANRKKAAH